MNKNNKLVFNFDMHGVEEKGGALDVMQHPTSSLTTDVQSYKDDEIIFVVDEEQMKKIVARLAVSHQSNSNVQSYVPTGSKIPSVIPHHRYISKDYFSNSYCMENKIDPISMEVHHINDGTEKIELSVATAVDVLDGGYEIIQYMKKLNVPIQMVAEHTAEDSTTISIFDGHFDKVKLGRATFIPIRGQGFALLAIKQGSDVPNHKNTFEKWKSFQEDKDQETLDKFVDLFLKEAIARTRSTDIDVHFFHLRPGRILSFPASSIYHCSIIPNQTTARILWICYEMVPTTGFPAG